MPPVPPPVRTTDLTREFRSPRGRDPVIALSGLDLRMEEGEVLGLLGPNGSGKSTTMKLLLGLLRATRGRAEVLGRPAGDRAALARVGYLPEETRLFPFLTARETARFFAKLHGMSGSAGREAADRSLADAGIAEAADRRVAGFSKGMGRRLGLACSLVGDPVLLILDEPTSGLDPLASADMKDRIRGLKGRGRTVVLSSHHLADVEEVCDRVVVLGGGRVVTEGRPADLLALRDEWELRYRGGDAGFPARVEEFVRSGGGEVTASGHPREDLETLFLRLFRGE